MHVNVGVYVLSTHVLKPEEDIIRSSSLILQTRRLTVSLGRLESKLSGYVSLCFPVLG